MEAPLAQVAISFGSVFAIPGLLNGEATRKPIAHGVCHFLGLWECPRFRKTLWDSCRLLSGVQKHAGIRADRASGREKHSGIRTDRCLECKKHSGIRADRASGREKHFGIRTDRCLECKNILGFEQIALLSAKNILGFVPIAVWSAKTLWDSSRSCFSARQNGFRISKPRETNDGWVWEVPHHARYQKRHF